MPCGLRWKRPETAGTATVHWQRGCRSAVPGGGFHGEGRGRDEAEAPQGSGVWRAGCATGEEAFSAAIVLAEAMGPSFGNQDVKIFGTDVDEKAIAHARKGQYARDQVESVSKKALAEWFIEEGDGYAVRKE